MRALLFLLLLLVTYLPPVVLRDPWEVDEVRYLEVGREMRASGDWLVTRLNGERYHEKPPLFFWTAGALGGPFGTRLAGQALAALSIAATVCLTVLIARELTRTPTAPRGDLRFAWLAGAIAASCVMFIDRAMAPLIDTLVAPLATLAALALLRATGDGAPIAWTAVASLACAGIALTKGPHLALFPLLAALLARGRRPRLGLRATALLVAPAAGAAAFFAWLWLADQRDAGLWADMVGQVGKRTGGGTVHHREPPWFYALDVARKLLPWTWCLPFSIALAVRRPLVRGPALWAGVGLLIFSCAGGKRPGYVLPLYVPLALLCAAGPVAVEDERGLEGRGWITGPLRAVPLLLWLLSRLMLSWPVLLAAALAIAPAKLERPLARIPLATWALVPALGIAVTFLAREAFAAVSRATWTRVALSLAGGFALATCAIELIQIPIEQPRQSPRWLAREVDARVPAGERLVLLAGNLDGRVNLWTGVDHYDVVAVEDLAAATAAPGRLWIVGREQPFELVAPEVRARFTVEVAWPGDGHNDFVLLRER